MNQFKKFVEVNAHYDLYGNIVPQAIIWDNGRILEIDKVIDAREAASLKAGGQGMRYHCKIRGSHFYLFLEEEKFWFLELPSWKE